MDFNLERFVDAQEGRYDTILGELRSGQKRTHWMWFVFPQIDGLGRSETALFYSIKSLDEARKYLHHPILGARLRECTESVLGVQDRSLHQIFGSPDDLKFCSSMTLFEYVSLDLSLYSEALDRYCEGNPDERTLGILKSSFHEFLSNIQRD